MPTEPGFYGVKVGRVPGVYFTWDACQKQILGFSCAQFKKFQRFEDAWAFAEVPPSLPPSKHSVSLALPSRAVDPVELNASSEDSKVGKGGSGGFKQGHVEKTVTTKRQRRHSESQGTKTLDDAETTGERQAKRSRLHDATNLAPFEYINLRPCTKVSTPAVTGPLAAFFAKYTGFKYNPRGSATDEFYRLCNLYQWDKHDRRQTVAKKGFQDALTMQFNDSYGTDADDITNWQALCARLGMDPVPESLKACQEAVESTHVNLVDLLDMSDTRKKVPIFPTVFALSEYTIDHGRFFPRKNVHAGSLLKRLLRHILDPELS